MYRQTNIYMLLSSYATMLKKTNLITLSAEIPKPKKKIFSSMASTPINIRWIRTGSRPYWIPYYIQFSTNIKMYNHNIKTSFVSPCLRQLGADFSKGNFTWNTLPQNCFWTFLVKKNHIGWAVSEISSNRQTRHPVTFISG